MQNLAKISVIIPCYNEEGNLEECVRRIPFAADCAEIIIVNDGSRDKTRQIAQRLIRDYRNIKLIDFLRNRGKTEAVREGINLALGEVIMIQDADLSVEPECLRVFYDRFMLQPRSFLMGTRFNVKVSGSAMPFRNQVSNRITARVFSCLLKEKFTDTLCGTKVFGRELKDYLEFSDCRWPDFDLLICAKRAGLSIKEIPVEYLPRKYGKSAMKLYPDAWQLLKRMLRALCSQKARS